MTDEQREALHLKAVLRMQGWRVAEELLHAALVQIQDEALDHTGDSSLALMHRAQGARQLVKKFNAAVHAAANVEAEPNDAGLASEESNDSAAD